MPPANSCPRCGRPAPNGVSFCASCGSTLSSTSAGKGWKLLLGAVALFGGLLWAAVLFTQPRTPTPVVVATPPQSLVGSTPGVTQAAQPALSPPLALTSAQHLAEAKKALADGYKPNRNPQKARWGEVAAAKWHLKAIGATAPEYREAQELLKEVARRERQAELARKSAAEDEDAEDEDADKTVAAAPDNDSKATSTAASPAPTYSSTPESTSARQAPPPGGSPSDYYTNSRGRSVHRPMPSENGPPAGATAQCRDGSYSFSQSRRGTCSHHGGVSRWL
jgi:hypothetical protein